MELFENCLFINLETRIDRLIHVTAQLQLMDISGTRFNAIKMKDGAIGCTMSHIKCLEIAKKNNWDYAFICEDDITFTNPKLLIENTSKFLDYCKDNNIDWDVLIIGGNNCPPYTKLTDFCIKVTNCQTTTGYIVKKRYIDTLITNFKESVSNLLKYPNQRRLYAVDMYWKSLQQKDNWFMIIPLTVIQVENYSDIEQKYVGHYKDLMLDLDKEWLFRK